MFAGKSAWIGTVIKSEGKGEKVMSIIIVVMPKVEDAKKIRRILVNHGFTDTIFCPTGAGALMEINKYTSGLVVSGYRLSDMYYRELSENLPKYFDILLIGSASAVSDNPSGLMSLTTPLKVFDLVNTVEMMIRQIDRRLKQDKRKPKKRSEREENYIHNAKRLLMDRNNLSEEEAHRYIQKCSMDNATNMVETAQMILMLIYDEC